LKPRLLPEGKLGQYPIKGRATVQLFNLDTMEGQILDL